MAGIIGKLLPCVKKPKREEEDEQLEMAKISRPVTVEAQTMDGTKERVPTKEAPRLPRINTQVPPAHKAGSEAAETYHTPKPSTTSSDPDAISPLAGSAPMYLNVKNALEDRRKLFEKLRRPPSMAAPGTTAEVSPDSPTAVAIKHMLMMDIKAG